MGWGDEILATGMARGAQARGKRIAFGDGHRIIWGPWSEPMFRNNPNIAPPGSERASDIEWIAHYKGHRLYNRHIGERWQWNMKFRATPGEMFFDDAEIEFAKYFGDNFILIEPNLPRKKTVAPNKDWGLARYRELNKRLLADGLRTMQFAYGKDRLPGAGVIEAPDFRKALAVLSRASLYCGPEGGLHHGAAAVNVRAVVFFGGFIPPQVTGYASHINLTGGAKACGSLNYCSHCVAAMRAISVDAAYEAAISQLQKEAA